MTAIHFFTDEDVYSAVANALRRQGIDALSTPEAGRRGQSDESQLAWATAEGRVLVTFNVAHFAALHTTWLRNGRHHAGVVVSSQRPVGVLVHGLLHLARELDDEEMHDRIEFLSDWS